jgi:hypothetical protein
MVDDFSAPELAPVIKAFTEGMYFLYGHTVLQRTLGLGYQSEWAARHLPTRGERNRFYAQAGRLIRPGAASVDRMKYWSPAKSPTEFIEMLER